MSATAIAALLSPESRKQIWAAVITPLTDEQRKKLREGLSQKGFLVPNEKFNEHGLRFDINYLQSIGGAICMLPLEFMSEYVDVVCKNVMDRNDGLMEESILNDELLEEEFPDTNTTALGNIAYVAFHTKNEKVKEKCLIFLEQYMNWHLNQIAKSLIEKLGNLSVQ